ncbi:TNF receptor-associated factor homolog 1b-like isoform X2 [Magnolia sinica]|uniref:TNF receptor-associated factor homolog 1b-like isoform X2 n=1 Tax=Magnolia sinica TaxID=86752 RepID=UPI0026588E92|nr:TNF receptor-associated factor homolog 1b-like isoform X2 [Magnolia sinica]XP_058085605.1 TNF receptor-associated factor homolog 1b-like isoform X2 [Magnolia sinica]
MQLSLSVKFIKDLWLDVNGIHLCDEDRDTDTDTFVHMHLYILIYPQGCEVCNHLSLFLCVANHDKLLPGWSHFAQFTIAVVNKDPKKSKYSDTLHRFCKKEHDWGWKKFMELSKVSDGFIVSDTLVIKAQVQVIREKADRPFRCLDCQYRRELVRVYLSNVEKICRGFVEERRGKLGTLIEDKVRWSSFRAFWLGIDHNARRRMSREKTDAILKVVVKHFFIEKEVTSTLVMDSLYSGLKALEYQSKNKKGRAKLVEMDEMPAPIVSVDKDMFVLADDVLVLLERAAVEPLPPKDDKGPQNRTKDGTSGEDFNKDSIDREERRLTELGRRTVEIFVLAHIFSNRVEVAYQEAVALKRQEELIREEEAAGLAESELKAKRGAAEKEKRTKKKQAKQRRSSRKGKDRGREEKLDVMVQEKHQGETPSAERSLEDFPLKQAQPILENLDTPEDVSNVSDTGDDVSETLQPDLEDRDASPVNWDTDTSEIHPSTEASCSGVSCLPVQNGGAEKKSPSIMDDSSSTCSTDSVPSVVMNGPYKGNSLPNYKGLTSPSRGKKQRNKDTHQQNSWGNDPYNPQLDPSSDVGALRDATGSCGGDEPESEAFLLSLKGRIQWLEQHLVEKEEEVVSLQKKLHVKDQVDVDGSPKQRTTEALPSPSNPMRNTPSRSQPKQAVETTAAAEPAVIRPASSNSPSQPEKAVHLITRSPQIPSILKSDTQKPATPPKATSAPIEKPATQQASAMSRPSSAPLIPAPRPNAPVVSVVQTMPLLSRSVSAAGRLGTDPLPVTHSYVPQSYRNAITGRTVGASSASFASRPSSCSTSPSPSYSQPPVLASPSMLSPQSSARKDQVRPGYNFGNVMPGILHSQPQWIDCSQQQTNGMACGPSLLNDIAGLDLYGSGSSRSRTYYANEVRAGTLPRQSQGTSADEFPHLDIINYLLDEEQGTGKAGAAIQGSNGGCHHSFNRQLTFPGDGGMADVGSSISCCRFDRTARYPDDGIDRIYGSSSMPYSGLRVVEPQVSLSSYTNGQMDGMMQNQWALEGADLSLLGMRNLEGDGYPFHLPDYSNLACGVNGFSVFRPANGH